jgi:hypothetical protein
VKVRQLSTLVSSAIVGTFNSKIGSHELPESVIKFLLGYLFKFTSPVLAAHTYLGIAHAPDRRNPCRPPSGAEGAKGPILLDKSPARHVPSTSDHPSNPLARLSGDRGAGPPFASPGARSKVQKTQFPIDSLPTSLDIPVGAYRTSRGI